MDFSSWINGFAVGLGCGVLIGLVLLLNKMVKYRRLLKNVKTENS